MSFDALIDFRECASIGIPDNQNALMIHFNESRLASFQNRLPKIHGEISNEARARGYKIIGIYGNDRSLDAIADNPHHLHIAQLDRPFEARNLVFVMPSYLADFWYVDPKGVRNHSSLRGKNFDPQSVDLVQAQEFAAGLYERFVLPNKSKWPQADLNSEPVEANSTVLILQAERMFPYEKRYVASKELIEASIATKGTRKLYIKPHPKAPIKEQEALLSYHNPGQNVEITTASIHDLLYKVDYMITQSSAVAFEANLHKTPAILTGETDFWHNAVTISGANALEDAINEALTRRFEYERYLYWFLHENMIATRPFECDKLWQKLANLEIPLAKQVLK